MSQGLISTIQRYSTKDGPGIRTTVFCMGCNLECVWCANPELITPTPKLMYYKQRCIRCKSCVHTFPDAITMTKEGCRIDRNRLLDPHKLVDLCPKEAYEWKGCVLTPQELTDKLVRDKDFYDVSHGGRRSLKRIQAHFQILPIELKQSFSVFSDSRESSIQRLRILKNDLDVFYGSSWIKHWILAKRKLRHILHFKDLSVLWKG